MRRWIILTLLLFASAAFAGIFAGPLMSQVEQQHYTVERADGAIELRAYPEMNVAQTFVDGPRGTAIQKGFRLLANYIFGANDGAKKIEMTAPVMQGAASGGGINTRKWWVRFVMPRGWSAGSLPRPINSEVTLGRTPAATFAVIRFSGFARDSLLQRKTAELKDFITRTKFAAKSDPIYAFYNPPWTLPFWRRNEILIEVAADANR